MIRRFGRLKATKVIGGVFLAAFVVACHWSSIRADNLEKKPDRVSKKEIDLLFSLNSPSDFEKKSQDLLERNSDEFLGLVMGICESASSGKQTRIRALRIVCFAGHKAKTVLGRLIRLGDDAALRDCNELKMAIVNIGSDAIPVLKNSLDESSKNDTELIFLALCEIVFEYKASVAKRKENGFADFAVLMPILRSRLKSSNNDVVYNAAVTIGLIGTTDEITLQELRRLAVHRDVEKRRAVAESAMLMCARRIECAGLLGDLCNDHDTAVAYYTFAAIAQLDHPDIYRKQIVDVLMRSKAGQVKIQAIRALGRCSEAKGEIVPILDNLLTEKKIMIRLFAAHSLLCQQPSNANARKAILSGFLDEDAEIRSLSCRLANKLTDIEAKEALIKALGDKEDDVVLWAAIVLARNIGRKEEISGMLREFQKSKGGLKRFAIACLLKQKDLACKVAHDHVVDNDWFFDLLLCHHDPEIRSFFLRSVQSLDPLPKRLRTLVRKNVMDDDREVRKAAMNVLSQQ